jgi:hypothetical protein
MRHLLSVRISVGLGRFRLLGLLDRLGLLRFLSGSALDGLFLRLRGRFRLNGLRFLTLQLFVIKISHKSSPFQSFKGELVF